MGKQSGHLFIEAMSDQLEQQLIADRETLWTPLPGPQAQALATEADELFYGGAAGGGKTDLLLGMSFTQHRKSVIYRREFPQFRDMIDRGNEIAAEMSAEFKWNRSRWELPNKVVVELGAVPLDKDLSKYKGRPHDLVAFDEAVDFTEYQFRFLTAWNRTTHVTQRTRVVACGNPPTSEEGQWVIRYWGPWLDPNHPNPAEPGELRWYAVLSGQDVEVETSEPFEYKQELIYPKSRTFIPARLDDNPFLLKTDYRARLQSLPEPLRSQLLYGDFGLSEKLDAWQVIPTEWVRAAQERGKVSIRPDGPPDAMGVDVARGGDDQTAIARLWGAYFEIESWPGRKTPDGPTVATLVFERVIQDESGWTMPIAVDLIGVGTSVVDTLRSNNFQHVIAFSAQAKSLTRARVSRLRFANKRAEAWWKFREALDPESGLNLALPPGVELLADLVAPRYKVSSRGLIIEEKEAIKKRLGRSPDLGDTCVLAWFARDHVRSVEAWSPDEW